MRIQHWQSAWLRSIATASAAAAILSCGVFEASAQFRPGFTNAGPRLGGPSLSMTGPRGPNINTGPTRTPDWGKGTGPKMPDYGRPRPPRYPGGGGIVVIPPGGGGIPPNQVIMTGPPSGGGGGGGNQVTRRLTTGVPPAGENRYVPDEVIIQVIGRPPQQSADALARRFRLTRLDSISLRFSDTTIFRWRIPDRRSVPAVIRQLEADRFIQFASPNYIYTASQTQVANAPADAPEGDPAQYMLGKLRLPQAHGLARGNRVLVAVIDSGVDARHPELSGVIADSFDATAATEPPHSHGTAIAGAIAAHSRLRGVAPAAQVLAIRAFGQTKDSAEGTTFSILKSIDWAIGKNARVINMSFAGPQDPALARMLYAARQKGAVLIAAVGNAGPKSPPLYPAADPNVIAVTATDAEDNLFGASNRGGHVTVAAPGVDILLPAPDGGYQVSSGTSFAAAHVSGIAALILERRPDLKPDAVRNILVSSARDLGPKGQDIFFGAGLADAYQALLSAAGEKALSSNAAASR